jgi:methionine-rich copper-binding protein CopC
MPMCKINKINLVAIVVLGVLGLPVPGSAQDAPKATFPPDGSTVSGDIEMVRVEFNEAIDPTISGLELRKGGTQLWLAGVGAGFCDTSSCQLLLGRLEPDNYTVTFDVLTPSGKVMKNQFTFIVGGTN